jgi:hypothetical protein
MERGVEDASSSWHCSWLCSAFPTTLRVVHRVRIVFIQDRQQTKGNLRKEEKKRGKKKSLTSRQANDLVVLVKSTSAGERANIASLASQVHHLHAYFKNAAKGGFRD